MGADSLAVYLFTVAMHLQRRAQSIVGAHFTFLVALFSVDTHSAPSDILTTPDYFRATQHRPRDSLMGEDFSTMSSRLNHHLASMPGLRTKPCMDFTADEIREVVSVLMSSRHDKLQEVYTSNNDRRALTHQTVQGLEQHWQQQQLTLNQHLDLVPMAHAAKCHQAVMLLVHHLTEATKREVVQLLENFPLLPTEQHSPPDTAASAESSSRAAAVQAVHADYVQESSCAAGHIIGHGNSTFNPGCLGSDECPVWPAEFSAPFGLYSTIPPIHNATSTFYYKVTDGIKKQMVDYSTYCFPFVNIFHYHTPCKLYFQPEGIFLSQPGHVNCCQFNSDNVSAVPIQFLHSYTLKESNVKAQDYYRIALYHMGPCRGLHYTIWGHIVDCIIPYGVISWIALYHMGPSALTPSRTRM